MNRQEAIKTVFDVLNKELIKPCNGTDTMAVAVAEALGFTDQYVMVRMSEETSKSFNPKPTVTLHGFQVINDMSNEAIIDEVLEHQRKQWLKASRNQLKKLVITARMADYQERLVTEAKFEPEYGNGGLWGLLGGGNTTTDE